MAVDLGEPTLAIARAKAPGRGAAKIDYQQPDAVALPFDDDMFDVAPSLRMPMTSNVAVARA